jgi:hypothetical protein
LLQRFLSTAIRLLLVAVGLFFALVLLAVGLLASVVVVAWALLRGRRPRVVRFRVDPRSPFAGMRRGPVPPSEVVDIEAREVPDMKPPLPHR